VDSSYRYALGCPLWACPALGWASTRARFRCARDGIAVSECANGVSREHAPSRPNRPSAGRVSVATLYYRDTSRPPTPSSR
jgi:hypothetical protein